MVTLLPLAPGGPAPGQWSSWLPVLIIGIMLSHRDDYEVLLLLIIKHFDDDQVVIENLKYGICFIF